MDYSAILYEPGGGRARITWNRPEKLNAIEHYAMAREKGLKAALEWRGSKFGEGRALGKGE